MSGRKSLLPVSVFFTFSFYFIGGVWGEGAPRFGDLTGDGAVGVMDFLEMADRWQQQYSHSPLSATGTLRGTLSLADECGNCVEVPRDVWLFLDGLNGTFCAHAPGESYLFSGLPLGLYTLIAGDMAEKYCHVVKDDVVILEGEQTLDLCLRKDIPAPSCQVDCPRGQWTVEFWSIEDGSATGTLTFFENGTFEGPVVYSAGTYTNIKIVMSGNYYYDEDCYFVMEGYINPRDGGGDCQMIGGFTCQVGMVTGNCQSISGGYFATVVSSNCPALDGDDIGTYRLSPPMGISIAAIPSSELQISSVAVEDCDLNDDGRIDQKDYYLLIDQWHVRIPSGPTKTPVATCTPQGGGSPTPTPEPITPTETPTPYVLEGLWLFNWRVLEPFRALWTSEAMLGDPGQVEEFQSQNLNNVTAVYDYNPETGLFTMDVTGNTNDGSTVAFHAEGWMNEEATEINDGVFTGTIEVLGKQYALSGEFSAIRCNGECPDQQTIEGWWDMTWNVTEPFAATWRSSIYFDGAGQVKEFESENLTLVSASYVYNPDTGDFSLQMTAGAGEYGQAVFTSTCQINEDRTQMNNGTFAGKITLLRERDLSGTFTGVKCPDGPCNPWY